MKGPAKSTKYTSKLTQWHLQKLLQSSNSNKCFVKIFSEIPPKKTCGKFGCSHNHGECPAHGTTYSKCGHQNHWAQQCRSSGRRNSSTGHSPALEDHRIDNSDSAASMPTKAWDVEEASSSSIDPLPTRNQAKAVDEEESHSRLPPSQLQNSSQDQHTLPK